MTNTNRFIDKINFRILTMLVVLCAITVIIISFFNGNNIRHLYEDNYTERVLLTNALMAALIDSEDVDYLIELIKNQDDAFKERLVQFYYDRKMLRELNISGGDENEIHELWKRVTSFYGELSSLKTEKYWDIVKELNHLKEVSHSEYLYGMADIGLLNNEGEILYIFIFDADDDIEAYSSLGIDDSLYIDGLGTSDTLLDPVKLVYSTKKQMDKVMYYNDDYGELYYAYAPILNADGDVIALLGTDLDLKKMNNAISTSVLLFNTIIIVLFITIISFIFIFLHSGIIKPLGDLTNTARELAQGHIYFPTSQTALKMHGEIGMLANAISDMSNTYQTMISSTGKLFDAANIGKLDVRNDTGKFKGDIKNVIKQINDTLDSMTLYLNSIPEGIIIMSRDLNSHFTNKKFINYFGNVPAREFVANIFQQNTPDGLSNEEQFEYHKNEVSEILKQANNNLIVWINKFCYSIIMKEIVLPNEASGNSILVIAVNITDLMKEKENAQAAARAKSDFLSRMSHEIRTPMNAIIGMTKISEATDDVSKLKRCLSTISTSSKHLLGIINDVLDMSKIDAGKFDLENVPLNIEKLLMKVCNIVIDIIEEKHQKLDVVLSKDLNLNYIADDLRLSQVITNLLSNAVKFTPENGTITLTVEKAGQKDNKNTLRFYVSDTGIGMTDEQLQKLFNAFEQADGTVSRKFGGTGLGLVISKSIVEKMDGRIWAESKPGEGSTFIFEVNLERAPHQDAIIFDGIRPEDIKLLIVENDDFLRNRLLSILESFGIRADTARSIDKTLELVEAAGKTCRTYDIVFLDYDMPGTNIIDFINKLSGLINKNTAIVITTYLEWNRVEKRAFQNNITHYITKPLFPSSVLDAINEVTSASYKSLDIKTDTSRDSTPDLSGVRIILAEDVEINREIFLSLLERTNITVDIAENGTAAVKIFRENPEKYNLIIMDIQMPEMDGYQATKIIRALDIPEAKTIPIIAMTANAFKEDIDRCLESGMNDHLSKPIDEKSVIEKILHYAKGVSTSAKPQ